MILLLLAFAHAAELTTLPASDLPVDAALVPGCPSAEDGALSACQWRRVVWAQHLYASGLVSRLIVSGGAVHNRYVEADALAAGLVALGVPDAAILREPQALHTDENVGYTLRLADAAGVGDLTVASDPGQAAGACAMVREWSDRECFPATLDATWLRARLERGLPRVTTEPVPAGAWVPLAEREAAIASAAGRRPRPSSVWVYAWQTVRGALGEAPPPPLLPGPDAG